MTTLRKATLLFAAQFALYGVICVNTRAIAQVDYGTSLASDGLIATLNFFIIRRIASDDEPILVWFGYVLGSLAGTATGIWASTYLTP